MIGNEKAAKDCPGFRTGFLSPLLSYIFTNVLLFPKGS
jgi:hypothetical protein